MKRMILAILVIAMLVLVITACSEPAETTKDSGATTTLRESTQGAPISTESPDVTTTDPTVSETPDTEDDSDKGWGPLTPMG